MYQRWYDDEEDEQICIHFFVIYFSTLVFIKFQTRPLLRGVRNTYNVTDIESGVSNDLFLLEMERILGVK